MRQMLWQNATAILLQNATEVYYKMRQFFYYKMLQLLQNATFITNCDSATSLHAVQYEVTARLCSDVLSLASLDTLFLCSAKQQAWHCF